MGGQPRRRAVHRHHSHRWRSGRPRLGAGLPPRRVAAPVPPQRLDPRLVRRVPRLPLLHGGPHAVRGGLGRRPGHTAAGRGLAGSRLGRRAGGPPSPGPLASPPCPPGHGGRVGGPRPLRPGPQVGHSGRPVGHAGLRVAYRPPGRPALPRPGSHRGGHPAVHVRPVVQHHGWQSHVDHGRRVRLYPGRGRRPRVSGPAGPGSGDRTGTGSSGRLAGPHRALPLTGRLLRPGGLGGGRRPTAWPTIGALVADHRAGGRPLLGLLGAAVLVAASPPQRHGVAQADPVPVLPVGPRRAGCRLLDQRPTVAAGHRGGRRRPVGLHRLPPATRPGAGRFGPLPRVGLRPPSGGPPLQRPGPARLLPEHLPPGRHRRRRRGAPGRTHARRPSPDGLRTVRSPGQRWGSGHGFPGSCGLPGDAVTGPAHRFDVR